MSQMSASGCTPLGTLRLFTDWPTTRLICSRCHQSSAEHWNAPDIGWGLCPDCYSAEHAVRHYGRGCSVDTTRAG